MEKTVKWYLENEVWWRSLINRRGLSKRLGARKMIPVFGQTGQVAKELQTDIGLTVLGRDQANLIEPSNCQDAIGDLKPDFVINAAAYTSVDAAENEEEIAAW